MVAGSNPASGAIYLFFLTLGLFFTSCSVKEPRQLPQQKQQLEREIPRTPIIYRLPKERNLSLTIQKSLKAPTWGEKIAAASELFLGSPYAPIKRSDYPKIDALIAQLDAMDCMCFVEYSEALARSRSVEEFPFHLLQVRYFDQKRSYKTKKHFFSHWLANGYSDVGDRISPKAKRICKHLNYNYKLPKIEPFFQCLWVVPSEEVSMEHFRNGDLLGVYAYRKDQAWLDVTHMGLVIYKDGIPYFRNASSRKKYRRVVDIPLHSYLETIRSFVLFRKTYFSAAERSSGSSSTSFADSSR